MTIANNSEEVSPSKFSLHKNVVENITIENIQELNDSFWNQESVDLHKCYRKGKVYANNGNKKTSINLLQDMFKLLSAQYKNNDKHTGEIGIIFENISQNLELVDMLSDEVDKNCILSIIQGYTLGCLNTYEKRK